MPVAVHVDGVRELVAALERIERGADEQLSTVLSTRQGAKFTGAIRGARGGGRKPYLDSAGVSWLGSAGAAEQFDVFSAWLEREWKA